MYAIFSLFNKGINPNMLHFVFLEDTVPVSPHKFQIAQGEIKTKVQWAN
jgi:hypothetical protein